VWTGGSRLEDGKVGTAITRREADFQRDDRRWPGMGYYLGANKEVYDAELYALLQAVKRFRQRGTTGRNFIVFADAQAALNRCRNDHAGPGKVLAKGIIQWSYVVRSQGNTLTLRWVPGHADVEGNEIADIRAKAAARSEWVPHGRNKRLVATTSLTPLQRKITERTAQETKEWIDLRIGKRRGYLPPSKIRAQRSPTERAEGGSCTILPVNRARPNNTVHKRNTEENRLRPMLVVWVG